MKFLEFIKSVLFGVQTVFEVPLPITNLKRVKSNVKITWEPSISRGVVSQRIIVSRDGLVIINKELESETGAFSFSAMRDSNISVLISPYNGESYGDAVSIDFKV